ncbi:CTP synthase C-terminal region-related (seleno)protein [[Clostridium] fimetarium]|uniref:CTP synthase (glutamine hydrolyzing) n=1 Tax=[Clostridium] fimetarium TaxID=99656 RepID=A0A1I0QTX6_9FIRM|nr:glutamine amidotransferase [[Clostridium] fimetarium]SEW30851.1 Glutamine amidotransferase class-I [[Clostridium] fimetarium]
MSRKVRIGIIGDYDGRPSHLATEEALKHSAKKLGMEIQIKWIDTVEFEKDEQDLQCFDGLWCAPGSPYKSMNGAINAIQYARENDYPFIGTCGGFQHAVIEYGRNVLQINNLKDINFNPYDANDFITALSCSLLGQEKRIFIDKNSKLYNIYDCTEIIEKYNCSFGLNKDFQNLLNQNGFKVVGTDENEEARIMTIKDNTFFFVSLFQPQLSSTYENPHPLISKYLSSAKTFSDARS